MVSIGQAGLATSSAPAAGKVGGLIPYSGPGGGFSLQTAGASAALGAQRAVLEAELATDEAPSPISLHPGIAEHYRRVVIDLAQALHRNDSEAAAEARDLAR